MNTVQINFGIAFIAGLVSFLSPCILPMVPIYIAQLVGPTNLSGEQSATHLDYASDHVSACNCICDRLYFGICRIRSNGQ